MFDFTSLQTAKKSAGVNQEKQQEQFESLMQEADSILMQFERDQSIETLQRAAEKFAECLDYKSTSPEPYYSLGVIFAMIGKTELAMEYFMVVKGMAPTYPGLTKMMNYVLANSKTTT